MPQFQMNGAAAPEFTALDAFTQAYIEAAFFTDEERLTEEMGAEMPSVLINRATMESSFDGFPAPSFDMLAAATLQSMIDDCAKFQADNADLLKNARCNRGDEDSAAGHDFWLTRNGHGAGFWDGDWSEPEAAQLDKAAKAFGEVSLYCGDDGQIYS